MLETVAHMPERKIVMIQNLNFWLIICHATPDWKQINSIQ